MAFCPDFSDSDDSDMSDDCDYQNFKAQVRSSNRVRIKSQIQTEEDKRELQAKVLFSALSSGNVQTVAEHLDSGLDVNINVQDGWTPLLLAASFGNPDLTNELIKRGADVNLGRDECSALMMACNCPNSTSPFTESLNVIKQLVENGADVKAINRKRMTALMFAANNGNLEAVRYLLPLSDKNAEDNQRWTALFWGVNSGTVAVVKYLLNEGFEYTKSDIRSYTPLDIAKHNDFQEIVELFPNEEGDYITNIIDTHSCNFEDTFAGLKKGQKPRFFLDICNVLCGVKAESVMKIISETDIDLYEFLSSTDDELKKLGINLPYQRNRILGGIYRFHKYPYHPKSIHSVPLKEVYSNIDIAVQILSSIKQVIAMEASLAYIMKHYTDECVSKNELPLVAENIRNVRKKVANCKAVLKKLIPKIKSLDNQVKPVDLIKKNSKNYLMPWRKIIFSFSLISVVLVCRMIKRT
ncbi:hypothetical protein NQ315_011599 [Exocentrus adspersus]|uniref:Ankyrin repeat, SAM and basic leucine zipper domain-containing protein 1 n=1 Tax=Exocentrus adspersus TaxID=1586481 RepID=A0AAV8VW51_9CUCU|nr:hypothetical protein NQ315_011599 [Exocentrus adspersus]